MNVDTSSIVITVSRCMKRGCAAIDGDDPTGLTGFEQTTRQDLDRDGCRSLAHADHDRLVTQDVHVATFNGGVVVDDLFVEEEVELLVLKIGW